MEIEVAREKFLSVLIDLEKLVGFSRKLLRHFRDVGEFSEIICGETHIASHFSLINAFGKDVAGVSENVLVKLDGYEFVPADELSEVGQLQRYAFPLNRKSLTFMSLS